MRLASVPDWLARDIERARAEGRILRDETLTVSVTPAIGAATPAATPAATTKPKRARRAPDVGTAGPLAWSITLALPCRVLSEANRRDHWAAEGRRKKRQREALAAAVGRLGLDVGRLPLPAVVTWTHVGPRMDDDNLQRAFKHLRDALAEMLGVDDGDDCVSWRYAQRHGGRGVELRIAGRGPAGEEPTDERGTNDRGR